LLANGLGSLRQLAGLGDLAVRILTRGCHLPVRHLRRRQDLLLGGSNPG
jgi:hypothetical protein